MRRSLALWLVLATVSGVALFLVKYEVQEREDQLDLLYRQTLENQEAIRVLKAEWSYLNQPARIEGLVRDHLGLGEARIDQMVGVGAIPDRLPGIEAISAQTSVDRGRQ